MDTFDRLQGGWAASKCNLTVITSIYDTDTISKVSVLEGARELQPSRYCDQTYQNCQRFRVKIPLSIEILTFK